MKYSLLSLILLGCLSLSAADREIKGRVVDEQTGAPLVRARVTVQIHQVETAPAPVTLLTDAEGQFKLTNVPESGFGISVEKNGYLMIGTVFNGVKGKDQAVVIRMTALVAIEGTVVDDQGQPVAFAFVRAIGQRVANGQRRLVPGTGDTCDENGHFRLFDLQAGRYYVSVRTAMESRRKKTTAVPVTYYPNTTDVAAAQAIDLKPGEEQQIRVRLPAPQRVYEISGVLPTSSPNVNVTLTRLGDSLYQQPEGGFWDPDTGKFRVQNVLPGAYLLTATSFDSKSRLRASRTLIVTDSDIAGVRLELIDASLRGTVRGAEGLATDYLTMQSTRFTQNIGPEADGTFVFPMLQPDTYRFLVSTRRGFCLESMLQSGHDVRDGLVISPDGASEPVEITLTQKCGGLDVSIAEAEIPQSEALIVRLLRKSGEGYVLEKQIVPVSRGAYHEQGITPGDYVVFAWPDSSQVEYANPAAMRQLEAYGKAVTITVSGKASVTLDKVIPKQ